MNLIGKLAVIGASAACMALSASAAFAGGYPGGNNPDPHPAYTQGPGNQDHNKGGDPGGKGGCKQDSIQPWGSQGSHNQCGGGGQCQDNHQYGSLQYGSQYNHSQCGNQCDPQLRTYGDQQHGNQYADHNQCGNQCPTLYGSQQYSQRGNHGKCGNQDGCKYGNRNMSWDGNSRNQCGNQCNTQFRTFSDQQQYGHNHNQCGNQTDGCQWGQRGSQFSTYGAPLDFSGRGGLMPWNSNCNQHRPPVRCDCRPQSVVFQFSTYGDWLLYLSGPALHNGETVTYAGQTWTVQSWTLHANGSQGIGTYFVLKINGTSLESPGTPAHPAHNVNAVLHTICTQHHPVYRTSDYRQHV